ncbi:hypothetical protein G3576_28475 [Roseomonas stagni]|uniref:ATP-binding protein n=1 Tax=Falsiroseomonas algicola TaxID=2716930 RepID=A0A6M1LU12_9PROT|nr:hypothetical protein [Falsiroseomonas algicola]NGM23976.1 hypothetical protein [Falsiroseomonas algicola]
MRKAIIPNIAEFFRVPGRFLRSAQLERDFDDPSALDGYVLTPPMADAFQRLKDGLRPGSGHRAWRITGDYGVGKSSFALALAHVLGGMRGGPMARLAGELGWHVGRSDRPTLRPVLVTGSRTSIVPALAHGIAQSVERWRALDQNKDGREAGRLIKFAHAVADSGSAADLEKLIEQVRAYAARTHAGVLLVVDEMGKLLEYAAQHPDREDVFVLQTVAEAAARSGERPLLFLGLLHQGFGAYAERLPSALRHEWDKVAGRFEELVFDQPLAHTAALVSGAIGIDQCRLPQGVRNVARDVARATAASGWLGGATAAAATLDAEQLYPLHPTLLPVLVRFFARFGQHERSLFGFLLSSEPFALQAFAARPVAPEAWYTLADFYDYVRAAFGHRLAGASYRSQWLRIAASIDAVAELEPREIAVLKAVAVLNLLDADDLLPTERAIRASFVGTGTSDVGGVLARLAERGLLFGRGQAGAYRLWPTSSVSLDMALAEATRALGPVETVASGLDQYLDREPILARRHYVERGTLRYFEIRYAHSAALSTALATPIEGDGAIVVALVDTEAERAAIVDLALAEPYTSHDNVVVCVTTPLLSLAPELHDVRCWTWVAANTPALAEDSYAAAEVERQLSAARRALSVRLVEAVGLRTGSAPGQLLFRRGKQLGPMDGRGISRLLSSICDKLFEDAPRIKNELLNRNALSSAAAGARMRLIGGIFEASDQPLFGMDPLKSPPEKSMYLSVLKKGLVHVEENGRYRLVEPTEKADPLNLRPAISKIIDVVTAAQGGRVAVLQLLDVIRRPQYGVRNGVALLLLAIVLRTRAHELAIYENGTFLHRFGPPDFLRLTKAPASFEIQHCSVEGVRADVFQELAAAFAEPPVGRRPDVLDVVRTLCQFAARLPEYTRRTSILGRQTLAVRDVLLSAREPGPLLFRELPQALDMPPFALNEPADPARVRAFVEVLREALDELRAAYHELIGRTIRGVASAVGNTGEALDRTRLAQRAASVSLVAREPRLRTFALRLRDPGLSDEAWAEALGSFIVAKPPKQWSSADEARFVEEVGALAELFHRVEAAAFSRGGSTVPVKEAVRVSLTRADGVERVRVVLPETGEAEPPEDLVRAAAARLPRSRALRLQILSRLLWEELAVSDDRAERDETTDAAAASHLERKR